ncbi:LysR family transcriptional regulator substrate-binding protein [Achromobacter xylosoxidans]
MSASDARPTLSRAPLFEQDMLHYAAAGAPSGELRGAPVIGYEDEQTGAPLAALAVHRIRCGLEGATVAEGLDCDAVAALVRAGAGIGALPRRYAEADPALAALPLEPVTLPVYLVRHEQAGASRADQSFLQFLASRLPAASTPRAASD